MQQNFDLDMFKGCDGVADAKRIGKSTAVGVTSTDGITLSNALRLGLKVGHEVFRVHMFVRPPRCCQSSNNTISNCESSMRCSCCAGQQKSSHFSPCQAANLKCANCGGPHVSFSVKCRILREFLPKKTNIPK